MAGFKQFNIKKFGYLNLAADSMPSIADHGKYVKVLYVKAGGQVTVDFKDYVLEHDAVFFINEGQFFKLNESCTGTMLYYNRDFYCVEMHDKEVACDGILFRNVYEIPVVWLNSDASAMMQSVFAEIKLEIEIGDSSVEEMLRLLLKQIIIRSTRIWKQEHHIAGEDARAEVEFLRIFSKMVDVHYSRYHTVAEYADMLNITPKALNKRITRYSSATPNEIIKNRIMLEAKRLLAHTPLSVKEVGYKLGYDDPNYFVRLFTSQSGISPLSFRQQYQLLPA